MSNERTSNIDDILLGTLKSPEPQANVSGVVEVSEEPDVPRETSETLSNEESASKNESSDEYGNEEKPQKSDIDEYGNTRAAAKTYTEDEVNQRINDAVRERLARIERNQPAPTQQQAQQAAKQGFEYNEESPESWQQQLESFVEQTVSKISAKKVFQANEIRERQEQEAFEYKFQQGKTKFQDFNEVVSGKPITDAMVLASRAMKDPAAFLYAASKREPKELERISRLVDPYAQIAEMGKLEERLKVQRPTTKTPRPVGRTQEDMPMNLKEDRQPNIEDMIQQSAAKKLALQRERQRR